MKLDFREFDKAYNEDIDRRMKERTKKQQRKADGTVLRQNLGYVLLFLLFFGVLANTVRGYVELNTFKLQNLSVERQIEEIMDEVEALQLELDEKTANSIIEDIAAEELGMVYPDNSQKKNLSVQQFYSLNSDETGVIVLGEDDLKAAADE